MTQSELAQLLAQRQGISQSAAKQAVRAILEAIGRALARGQRVELRNFGCFFVKQYAAHQGKHPRLGTPLAVPARRLPAFRVGKQLHDRLQAQTNAAATTAPPKP